MKEVAKPVSEELQSFKKKSPRGVGYVLGDMGDGWVGDDMGDGWVGDGRESQ